MAKHPTLLYHSRHDRSREGRELKEVRLGRCGAYDAYRSVRRGQGEAPRDRCFCMFVCNRGQRLSRVSRISRSQGQRGAERRTNVHIFLKGFLLYKAPRISF